MDGMDLVGSLPDDALATLTSLILLDVSDNRLVGTIPTGLQNLIALQVIELNGNLFHGTIPDWIGSNLTKLTDFYVYRNQLTGNLPSSLGNLVDMHMIVFAWNMLNGTVPASFGNLTNLVGCGFQSNAFTGTIPNTFQNLTKLSNFYLYSNHLTGTIPSWIDSKFTSLQNFYAYENLFTGSISPTIGQVSTLTYLAIDTNLLTGEIPPSLGNLTVLNNLYLHNNYLYGELASSIGDLVHLVGLSVANNQLIGSIPHSYSNLVKLTHVDLSDNYFTGSIFNVIQCYHCQQFDISNNMFTGYLPTLHSTHTENDDSVIIARNMNTSAMFPVMQVFDIGDNLFTGSIPNVTLFGDTLQVLYLNQNSFTGTIPPWIFIGTSLFSVIMSSNCLSGTLPESMCYNVNGTLSELVLDGLHSASSCQQRAFPTIKNSGIVMYSGVHGTLPSCIFQIPSLTKLHIGGNALHGTLANVPYTTSLIEFVATTNEFTGEVPSSLWQSNVNVLDLSFNRLRGTLPSDMLPALRAENASLKLRVNQLSGDIPSILSNLSDINILEGNMFSCDFTRSQLPSHDPKESTYNCGSNATNDSFIVFLLASALMGCLIWWINPVLLDIFTSIQTIKDSVGNCKLFTHSLPYIEQVTCMILLFVVLSAMIAYGVLSIYYSTYSHSYIWTVCGIFLQGPVATVVLMLLLTTDSCHQPNQRELSQR